MIVNETVEIRKIELNDSVFERYKHGDSCCAIYALGIPLIKIGLACRQVAGKYLKAETWKII